MKSLILVALLVLRATLSAQTPATGAAAGRITSMDGAPISGMRVIALGTAYPRLNIASQTETDKDGRFILDAVDPGEYWIIAEPFKHPSFYPGVATRDDAKRVTIAAGQTQRSLDFRFTTASGVIRMSRNLSPGAVKFSGIIRDVFGKPEPNITIVVTDPQTKSKRWTVTDANGAFELSNLKAGEFSVSTFSSEFDWNRPNAGKEQLSFSIVVAANQNLQVELGLRRYFDSDLRPDLYVSAPARPREEPSTTVQPQIFWRLQKLDEHEQPRASTKGSVDIQLRIDSEGDLQWVRAASRSANPELARAVIEAVGSWRFIGLKLARNPNRLTTDEGDPTGAITTLTFTFP